MREEKVAVYAGSFNPFTKGHLSVVMDAAKLFDKVFVCMALNSDKTERKSAGMLEAIIDTMKEEHIENVQVVCLKDILVADFCNSVGANYLIRALRNTSDYLYEENIAKINYEINPNLVTIYLRARPEYEAISSSMVRELFRYNKDVGKYLPTAVANLYK